MTTVATKDGIMAADSKVTDAYDAFCTRTVKIFRLSSKALVGCAGDADVRELLEVLSAATSKKLPTKAELIATKTEFSGLLLLRDGAVFFIDITGPSQINPEWSASVVECKERFAACGSGYQFAMGAMAAGASAKHAVEIATRYDTQSGMPVIEVPLKPLDTPKKKRNAATR